MTTPTQHPPPAHFEFPHVDRCLCNGVHIRNGAKFLALLDEAAAIVILVASVWEYSELKYVKPSHKHSTPILDTVFVATVLICISLAFAASLLLIDTISDRGSRYPCMIEFYILRRLISAVSLPSGVLISVIGLINSGVGPDGFVRRCVGSLASELVDNRDFEAGRRSYVDGLLGAILTTCVIALPFDFWASVITYRYYKYVRARDRCRRFLDSIREDFGDGDDDGEVNCELHSKSPMVERDPVTEITVSETDFTDAVDARLK